MKTHVSPSSNFVTVHRLIGASICLLGVFLTFAAFAGAAPKGRQSTQSKATASSASAALPSAATPPSGTLTPSNPVITYTDGPTAPNPTGVLGAPVCSVPNSCSDFVVTISASSVAGTHNVTWSAQWSPANVDQDMFVEDAAGHLVANNNSTVDPSVIVLPIPPDGTVYHLIVSASVGTAPINGSVSLTTKFPAAQQGAGAPPRYLNYPAAPSQANGSNEPSMGVDWNPNNTSLVDRTGQTRKNTGGVAFFTGDTIQWRTDFDDCASPAYNVWTNTGAPIVTGLDPIGFVDHFASGLAPVGIGADQPRRPGRVFGLDLAVGTSTAAFSDDDGASWTAIVAGNYPAGPDHETLGGGPFHAPFPTPPAPAYPNAIYYCSQNGVQNAECSRSDDGGVTYGPGLPIFDPTVCGGGIHGHLKVSPQGTVYVPNSSCGAGNPVGANGVAVSTNNGITWAEENVAGSTGSQDPAIGIGQNDIGKPSGQVPNTIYLGWISGDGHAHAAHSPNEGQTWQDDTDISSIIGSNNSVFPIVVAGDDNRAAYAFLGTDPDFAPKQVWHLYIATTYDGGHSWIVIDQTPDDPVQIGNVCLLGIGCTGGRNLLDFNGIDVDKEGRVLVGYTDGCVNCSNTKNTNQSSDAHGTIARQSGGRRLFSAFDPVEPAPPAAPQVISATRVSSPASGVEVSWLKPDNGGSAITGYNVYRGATSGSEMFVAHVFGADTLKYLDTTADPVNNSFYKVMAVNMIGESTYCHELSINAVQPGESACQAPYLTEAGAGTPGVPDETMGELTIQRVGIGEPFVSCTSKTIVFQMKVTTMDPGHTGQATPPPNSIWQILVDVPGTVTSDGQPHTIFVTADTESIPIPTAQTVQYSYGYRGPGPTGGSFDATDSCLPGGLLPCPVTGTMSADGTITITLDVSNPLAFSDTSGTLASFTLNRMPTGTTLTHVQGETSLLVGAAPGGTGGGASEPVSTTSNTGTYKIIGNINCSAGVPVAGLTATPMSGPAPLNVNFDGSSSSDTSPCATIQSYALDFGDGSTPASQNSPLFSHTYQSPGDYPARLTATDTAGRVSNAVQIVVHVASNEIQPTGVVSRKIHGSGGPTFDIALPSTGVAIEPRAPGATGPGGGDYQLVFVFPNTLTSVGGVSASATGGTQPTAATGAINSNDTHQYIVNITGVPNAQYLTVTLNNVLDSTGAGGTVAKTIGVLVGDVNQSGVVDSGDVFLVRQQTGQNATASNFKEDVNATGLIDSGDVFLTRQNTATSLPTSP